MDTTLPDDLSIPGFLRQEDSPARRAQRTRITNEMRRGTRRIEPTSGRSTISAGHAANLDEAGKALLSEVRAKEREKDKREKARLRALPKKGESAMAKTIGKKEQQLRDRRTGSSKAKPAPKLAALAAMIPGGANVVVDPAAKDVIADLKASDQTARTMVTAVDGGKKNPPPHAAPANGPKRKTGKAAKTVAKVAAGLGKIAEKSASTRPDGLRQGSKQAVMLDMALAPGGATEEAICKKLGWKRCRVTLKRVCDKVGAKLSRDDKTGKFQATLRKAA